MLDQHQADYDEANSTTYGAATSLRETGEVNFNFREYDDYLDQFYRVRIDSVKNQFCLVLNLIYVLLFSRYSFIFWTKIRLPIFSRALIVRS